MNSFEKWEKETYAGGLGGGRDMALRAWNAALASPEVMELTSVGQRLLAELWEKLYEPAGHNRASFNRDTAEFRNAIQPFLKGE